VTTTRTIGLLQIGDEMPAPIGDLTSAQTVTTILRNISRSDHKPFHALQIDHA
jgi:hypothetical protein